jgi:hypothetical protein
VLLRQRDRAANLFESLADANRQDRRDARRARAFQHLDTIAVIFRGVQMRVRIDQLEFSFSRRFHNLSCGANWRAAVCGNETLHREMSPAAECLLQS